MKKIIIALSLVLGVGGISALQAQMRIYNANLVYETDFDGDRCSVHGIRTEGLHLALLKTPEQTYVLKVLIR